MAGGTWITQNKVLPGVYMNYVGKGANPPVTGDRGIVGLPVSFPWLAEQTLIPIYPADVAKLFSDFGDAALLVIETMKNASLVYLFRLNKGVKAAATLGNLVATAVYSGSYGNRFSVSVENAVGQTGKFYVVTWFDADEIERQLAGDIDALKSNAWLTFSKSGEENTLAAGAGTKLAGGADGTVTNADYTAALTAFETRELNAIACPCAEIDVKNLYIAFAKRMINDEGKYLQVVVADSALADFEGVISVKNGVTLENGTLVDNVKATAYIAGATAACPLAESLTDAAYLGAVDVDTRYTTTEQITLAKMGQLVFLPPPVGEQTVTIQKDINTLVSFTDKRTYALSKNKIIRTVFDVGTTIAKLGRRFKGKTANNAAGRDQFKAAVLADFRRREQAGELKDVTPEDITVRQGDLIDAVVVDYAIRPVDVMEIFYGTLTVEG